MVRLFLGIVKGGVIGAALGYLAGQTGLAAGPLGIVMYGVIGAVVGVFCGRPLWRQDTMWTSILKAVFGFVLGVGATFAGRRWLGGVHLPLSFVPGSADHALPDVPALFGTVIGVVYGMLVELDDAGGTPPTAAPRPLKGR